MSMFTYNDLHNLLSAKPFVPFRLILSDGGAVEIPSHELVLPGRRFALVGLLDPDAKDSPFDRWTVVWYMHVTRVEYIDPGMPPFSAPPSGNQPAPMQA
jgi:hypothetical protein